VPSTVGTRRVPKPSTSPSTERAILKQMSEKQRPNLPATASSGAPPQQAQSKSLPPSSTYRHWQRRHDVTDPQNNLSCPKKYENAKKTKSQLVEHGDYACIANCRTKVPRYFKKYLEFYAEFQNFINVFKDFSVNPERRPAKPSTGSTVTVQSALCCHGAAFKGMMGEETGRSVHMYSPQNEAIA